MDVTYTGTTQAGVEVMTLLTSTPWKTVVLANQKTSQHVTPQMQLTHTEMDVTYTGTTQAGVEVMTLLTSNQ